MPRTAKRSQSSGKPADRTRTVPAVVLADATDCREFDVLQRLLEALDVPVVRVGNADGRVITAPVAGEGGALALDGQRIRPIVAWVRHATTAAIYSQMIRSRGAGTGLLEAECWSRLWEAVTATATTALPGSHPRFTTQLLDASHHGVRVPRTFVTTNIDAARHRIAGSRIIAKIPDSRPLASASSPGLPPPSVDGRAADGDGGCPVVVQEYVEHARELRVYHTGGGITAFEVQKAGPASVWTEPESVIVTRAECPPRLTAIVRRLAAAWGLHYGAFDFLITRSGEPLFLEVNADGDWLWFERRAQWQGVSFMVAAMISELFARNSRAEVA